MRPPRGPVRELFSLFFWGFFSFSFTRELADERPIRPAPETQELMVEAIFDKMPKRQAEKGGERINLPAGNRG